MDTNRIEIFLIAVLVLVALLAIVLLAMMCWLSFLTYEVCMSKRVSKYKKSVRKKRAKKKNARKKFFKKVWNWLKLFIDLMLSWVLIPISCIVPVKKGLVLFMGRQHSGFLDNNKYLLMYLKQTGKLDQYDIWFMGHRDKVVDELESVGFKTENYFSLKTYWLIMRADIIITDNAHWTTHNRYNIAGKANKIQLWHGIGFKKIRLSDPDFVNKSKGLKGFLRYKLQGQLATYDTFVSTSKFFSENVFKPSFQPKEIVNLGYCRNDVLFEDFKFDEALMKINTDVDTLERVRKLKEDGNKIVIYSPTFRNAKKYNVNKEEVDFDLLDEFGRENNIVFVFKLHPLPKNMVPMAHYQNIIEYNSKCDVYPLFSLSDMMITDYSSIYLDYVMLDKPIAFFMYDLDYYTKNCRGIRDDFTEMLPGAKCLSQDELVENLYNTLVFECDDFKEERKSIRDMSWEYQDGRACERVWGYIENKYLLDDSKGRW